MRNLTLEYHSQEGQVREGVGRTHPEVVVEDVWHGATVFVVNRCQHISAIHAYNMSVKGPR